VYLCWSPHGFPSSTRGWYSAFPVGLLAGLSTGSLTGRGRHLVFVLVGTLVVIFVWTAVTPNGESNAALDLFVMGFLGPLVSVSVAIGIWLGNRLGNPLRRELDEFGQATFYLRKILWPVIGYTFVYLSIIVVFAGFFAAACRLDPKGSFGINECVSFWEFFYFSLNTITGLEYSDLKPYSSPLTKTLASLEVVIGIGWTVIVFAAVLLSVQDKREPKP
jgi:ion channel